MTTHLKICNRCKQSMDISNFTKDKQKTDGHYPACRMCLSSSRKTYKIDKEAHNLRNKVYYRTTRADMYRKDVVGYLLSVAKKRANKFGLPYSISKEDIVVPEKCPILGCYLDILIPDKKQSYQTGCSLDRIINDFGYVKGNVRIISRKANRMKSDLTIKELENILKYMKGEI